jgi:hypothetical protein
VRDLVSYHQNTMLAIKVHLRRMQWVMFSAVMHVDRLNLSLDLGDKPEYLGSLTDIPITRYLRWVWVDLWPLAKRLFLSSSSKTQFSPLQNIVFGKNFLSQGRRRCWNDKL